VQANNQTVVLFSSKNSFTPPLRVVVTGVGMVTSLGTGWKTNAEGFRQGRVGIRAVTLFDVSRQRVKVGGEATLPPALPESLLSTKQAWRLDQAAKLLVLCAQPAWH